MEAEVEAAYLAAFDEYYRRAADPQSANTPLDELFAGVLLESVELDLAAFADGSSSIAPTSGPLPRPEVTEVTAEEESLASVDFCIVDGLVVRDAQGEVIDGDQVSRRGQALLAKGSDGWLVFSQESIEEWDDLEGCR